MNKSGWIVYLLVGLALEIAGFLTPGHGDTISEVVASSGGDLIAAVAAFAAGLHFLTFGR